MLWYTSETRRGPYTTCITCGQNLTKQLLRAIFCRGSEEDPWIVVGWECLRHDKEHGPRWPPSPLAKQFEVVPCMPRWGYQNKTPFTGLCDSCGRGIGMEQTYRANMQFNGKRWVVNSITCHACGWKDKHPDRVVYLKEASS